MRLPPLTRDQVRRVDQVAIQEFGIPGIVLMENAGRGAADVIQRVAPDGRISILCGSGNNAGDGYVIARHLQLTDREVRLISIVPLESLSGDAAVNAQIAVKSRLEIHVVTSRREIDDLLDDSSTIVDALLGTGARGAPRGLFADAVLAGNEAEALRIAIDLPTGMDCDTGFANEPTFRADQTITFVARKIGFDAIGAEAYLGTIWEIPIGVPRCLLEDIHNWK
jgi:NAD(P)H-hydrate epimerase